MKVQINIKNVLNRTAIILLEVLAFLLICYAIIRIGKCLYSFVTGGEYHASSQISEDIQTRYYSDKDFYRCFNRRTRVLLPKRYEFINDPIDGDTLVVFCDIRGNYGFLDINSGRPVISAGYSKAWKFSEGLAGVTDKDGKLGFIDKNGVFVIPPSIKVEDEDIDCQFHNGLCVICDNDNNVYTLMDRSGNMLPDKEFDDISRAWESGWYIVSKKGKSGLLDKNGDIVLPLEYPELSVSGSGPDAIYVTADGVKRKLSLDGTIMEDFVCDMSGNLQYKDEEGNSRVSDKVGWFSVEGRYGALDCTDGHIIIPAIYEDVNLLSPDVIVCNMEEEGGEIFFDIEGNKVIG